MEREEWRVGELAGATGLTVRTLHHYDEIGLLKPSARTAAGHRLYSGDDVRRLYSIVALRGLGFSLGDVADLIRRDGADPRDATRRRLSELDRQIGVQQRLRRLVATRIRLAWTSDCRPGVRAAGRIDYALHASFRRGLPRVRYSRTQIAPVSTERKPRRS